MSIVRIFTNEGGNSMSERDREALRDFLWIMGITFIIAYPFGSLFAPEVPPLPRFGFGIFAGGWLAYGMYMGFIALPLKLRRLRKIQKQKRV